MFERLDEKETGSFEARRMWSDDPSRAFRRYGGMKFYVLWLLRSKNMKGSEIINEIESQTLGWWRPSPGTIYPLLSNLEKEGLIQRDQVLRYSLTEKATSEFFPKNQGSQDDIPKSTIARTVKDLDACVTLLEDEVDHIAGFRDQIIDVSRRLERLLGREQ